MTTRAVTDASSALAHEEGTQFLPTDKHYRLTGEMPADTADDSASSKRENEDDGAGNGATELEHRAENADEQDGSAPPKKTDTAASEAASAQRKTGKTTATSENRFQKLSRENRELREKFARLESRGEATAQPVVQRETKQDPPPATAQSGTTHAEPKIDDIDPKTNKPKYATLGDFLADQRKWDREQVLAEIDQRNHKTQRDQQLTQAEKVIEQVVNERAAEARKSYTDYDTAIKSALEQKDEHGQEAFFYSKGSPIDGFFLDSERGHDVMYAIAKAFDAHKHIFARDAKGNYLLNPVRQLRELSKIENTLPAKAKAGAAATDSSVKPITQAPRPPHQVSGNGSVTKDAVEQSVEEGDFAGYAAAANARALAKLRKKG